MPVTTTAAHVIGIACGQRDRARTLPPCPPRSSSLPPLFASVRWALLVALVSAAPSVAQPRTTEAQTVLAQAEADFLAGRVAESVKGFDRVVQLVPTAAPQLWQRGIALYYVGRYQDCKAQFELHRTVNPSDVENPAWHFLCVARLENAARAKAALLPVGPDQRTPMREVYQMFQGTLAPEKVLAAAAGSLSGQFYAELYVGLYYEALGNDALALKHLTAAAADRFAKVGGYMYTVARLHPRVRAANTR
jgi:lipoprotein NlpI